MTAATFETASAWVRRTDTGFKPTQASQLAFYGLYKQATEGNVSGERPGMLKISERAKYDAWASRKGMTKEQAKDMYVKELDNITPEWKI